MKETRNIKFLFILFLITVYSIFSFSQNDSLKSFTKIFTEFSQHKDFENASIGLVAIDYDTGEQLGELNSNLSLTPASILKLIITATAIEIFGLKKQLEPK